MKVLANAPYVLGGEPAVTQRRTRRESFRSRRDRPEAQDRAGGADDALETGAGNLMQVLADLGVDVPHELALVARLERIGFHEAFGQADHAKLEAPSELDRRPGATCHLDAAAADVDDDRDVARHADAVPPPQGG